MGDEPEKLPVSLAENLPARQDQGRRRRWVVLRDLAIFQFKLLVDGIKDIVLAPLSLVAGIVGLVTNPENPGQKFYEVLRAGERFDRWINLFEPVARVDTQGTELARPEDRGLDGHVARLEQKLVEQHGRSPVVARAKGAVDTALDAVSRRSAPSGEGPGGGSTEHDRGPSSGP